MRYFALVASLVLLAGCSAGQGTSGFGPGVHVSVNILSPEVDVQGGGIASTQPVVQINDATVTDAGKVTVNATDGGTTLGNPSLEEREPSETQPSNQSSTQPAE